MLQVCIKNCCLYVQPILFGSTASHIFSILLGQNERPPSGLPETLTKLHDFLTFLTRAGEILIIPKGKKEKKEKEKEERPERRVAQKML